MVMYNRVRIQQECIEYICEILGPEVYEAFEGSGTRTRLQYALEKRDIYQTNNNYHNIPIYIVLFIIIVVAAFLLLPR